MTVRDIARPKDELVTATIDTPIQELAKMMEDRMVGSVIVADGDSVEGIVTDRDIALKCVGAGGSVSEMKAKDVMTEKPFTVDANTGVYELFRKMHEHGVRRAPIVDDGKLSGIITFDDLLVLLEDEMHELSEIVRAGSPPYTPA
ncbi:CBS domain-containing protein [Haloferax mediterranei ATCC 33500]|uniref:CBS domain-containing protein n=1 Tax=Haloferax mediterranei (strain ATCC 33500 / DSM 1411 / JCM 8866 / NBRC 14739 / NCIMB 2177 / R-4) TaxID=523841 RepID=I3R3F3_HALMT|nr:CBS domain-containing protein [Haloferax mediterranei]AFK18763.1 MaoC family protein [Haloferax mediterranei ATCC 33500]AHZ21868.1 signal transduction protein [Haloferax mediterranei ATCC 33500]EMA03377.1 MaoC family protein [Haloferax mediterranei ATCC 33500]MDX5988859.1 CBS domain-containing protein [Haloferax mediterranei ATCC 33500]QCQ75257.1 CBS domain-containing protein [Haloferax mediterranei ATCC 33500]